MKLYILVLLSMIGLNIMPLFGRLSVNNKEFITAENIFNGKKASFFKEKNFISPFVAHPERNNPFNIVYTIETANFLGVTMSDAGFCVFDKEEYGIRCGIALIQLYFERGENTIEKFVNRFTDTNKDAYKQFLTTNLGIREDSVISASRINLCLLGHLITVFEGQYGKEGISINTIKEVSKKYKYFSEIEGINFLDYLKIDGFYRDKKVEETNNNNNENISN